jgi:type I restriction enzyme, S subunit
MMPIRRLGDVFLGKMIQPEAKAPDDVPARYLRAAHVQPRGQIIEVDDKTMWFSPDELRALDLRADDVVVVEGGAGFGRSAVMREGLEGWGFQNSIVRIRPFNQWACGRFIDYALQSARVSREIEVACFSATIPHFTADKVGAFPVPAPSIADQRAIADFLDRETAQIDELIAEQEHLIELLAERRAAVVDRVTWRGLSDAPLAPSRIDSVGDAPAHWHWVRNKNLLFESQDLSEGGAEEMLSVSHLTGITPRADKSVTMLESESLDAYRTVRVGDLVVNTMWAWMGALGVSRFEGIVSPAYGVYRPRPGSVFDPTFFDYLYRSRPYVVEMTRHSRGIWSSRLRIYPEVFLRLPIVVPPLEEQRAIAAYLGEQVGRIDALIAEAERLIELSRERRSALITAAVTGQIDVRSVA